MSKKLSTFAPLLGYFLLLVGALFVGMVHGQTCGNNECKPWSSPSCKRGNQIPMVFQLANQEDPNYLPVNFSSRNVSLGPSVAAFPYCAEVDQLQAFLLYDAITAANSLPINTNQSGGLSMSYLSLRGTGPYQDTNAPTMDQSAVAPFVVWNAASLGCTGQQPIAVARFLIFNITMTNGIYKLGGDGGVPIQTGFDPTCDGNTCLLDDGFCIGNTGAKNCARCYDLATGVKPNVTVFAAYYGTDNSGRSFKSGSLNPLNFEQFAWQPVYKSVSDGVLG